MWERLREAGRQYAADMDPDDLAAVKLCMLSAGVLVGVATPLRWKKSAAVVGSLLFTGLALPLMTQVLDHLDRTDDRE